MQQADGLGVAGNRHGGDGAFGGQLLELDAHGGDKLAHAAGEVGVQVLGNAGLNQLCFDLFGGEAEFLFFVRQFTGLGFQCVLQFQ